MNNKHFVGKRISAFELYDEIGPITGVSLLLDDVSKPIDVGNDTGYVLEVSCPYGTEQIANNILSTLKGRTYKGFRAENAILSPAAELGDSVSVNGGSYLLAHRAVTFGPGFMSEIAAPGENELEREYTWTSREKREANRKLAQIRSEISKTNEEIALKISSEDAESLIKQTLNNVTLSVSSNEGVTSISLTGDGVSIEAKNLDLSVNAARIEGKLKVSQIEAEDLHVKAANIDGTIQAKNLNLSGLITWDDLSSDVQNEIESAGGLSKSQVKTTISEQLVASPEIRGGVFKDIYANVEMYLDGKKNSKSYGVILNDNDGEIFSIWNGAQEVASLSLKGEEFLSINDGTIYAWGVWDFSNATVIWPKEE